MPNDPPPAPTDSPPADEYSVSAGLAQRLARANVSLAFTSYQSSLLYFVGRNASGGINVHQAAMPKPMGLHRYVTAVSRSDTIDGWRDRRADGGIVVDVRTDAIVCEGLSMPHSPRLYRNELWLFNSGTGELGTVAFDDADCQHGRFEARAFCPGFLRRLAFHGNFAYVGLSKPRYKRFEGLALDQRLRDADSEPWCGIQIIDLASGACVDWFRIDGAVGELYDIEVLPGIACPMAVPPHSAEAASLITYAPE